MGELEERESEKDEGGYSGELHSREMCASASASTGVSKSENARVFFFRISNMAPVCLYILWGESR